ncbi:MAG: radical SAM family heme chaperone HemW [Desulforegulaceae bacterium]|nr:radical SAM family heme chaperone HemW [Desulforegulaceae bacterium]
MQGFEDCENSRAGIYIHVPFCVKKCSYCDFYSIEEKRFEEYFEAVIKSIDNFALNLPIADSIYFGGGTPSVLPPDYIEKIIQKIKSTFKVADDLEITLELNPGTISKNYFQRLFKTGVNRLNIGVQSFDDENLKLLGRIHSSKKAEETYFMARDSGFFNIGLDLIYALPFQTKENLLTDLSSLVSLNPEHISAYMLTLEKNTKFYSMYEKNEIQMLSEEISADFFLTVLQFLGSNGYKFYEVSNFAKSEKFFSRHNQKHWNFSPYIGFGPSAHSFFKGRRWSEPPSFELWYSNIINSKTKGIFYEEMDLEQQKTEFVFLGLRTSKGIDLVRYKTLFNEDFLFKFDFAIKFFLSEELILISSDFLVLTERGFLFSDYISLKFIENV